MAIAIINTKKCFFYFFFGAIIEFQASCKLVAWKWKNRKRKKQSEKPISYAKKEAPEAFNKSFRLLILFIILQFNCSCKFRKNILDWNSCLNHQWSVINHQCLPINGVSIICGAESEFGLIW